MSESKRSLILIQMGSDHRVPGEAIGYLFDLASPQASQAIITDRLSMLERYIPDLVQAYREAK